MDAWFAIPVIGVSAVAFVLSIFAIRTSNRTRYLLEKELDRIRRHRRHH